MLPMGYLMQLSAVLDASVSIGLHQQIALAKDNRRLATL
jgi:hypothetical protein